MKLNLKNFKSCIGHCKNSMEKHLPELLAGTGVTLLIASGINAVLVTPKASKALEEKKDICHKDKLTIKEVATTAGKYYVMPITGALLGASCIFASVTTSNKRYLAMSSAYSFVADSFATYKDKVIETVDENTRKVIDDKYLEAKVDKNEANKESKTSQIITIGDGEVDAILGYNGQKFRINPNNIQKVINQIDYRLIHYDGVSVNEVIDFLNDATLTKELEKTNKDYAIGWSSEDVIMDPETGHPHFEIMLDSRVINNKPYLVLDWRTDPVDNYNIYN